MSGLTMVIKLASRRADEAALAWQRLRTQCEDAKHKLLLLQRHGEEYRDRMRSGLQRGMAAPTLAGYLEFIGQIEAVVRRQRSELEQLEEACAGQWLELVELRRERRMFEILSERAAARDAAVALRRLRAETDESLGRAARSLPPI